MTPEEQTREALMLWQLRREGRLVFWDELGDQSLLLEAQRRGIDEFKTNPKARELLLQQLQERRRQDPPYPLGLASGIAPPSPRRFKKGDVLVCISKSERWHDHTIGRFYVAADDSYFDSLPSGGQAEFVELERNDSCEPYQHFFADSFAKVEE